MKPQIPCFTVTAEIHHGNHRATIKATGHTVALAAAAVADRDPGYLFTPGTAQGFRVIHELETTGQSSLGWVNYTATRIS